MRPSANTLALTSVGGIGRGSSSHPTTINPNTSIIASIPISKIFFAIVFSLQKYFFDIVIIFMEYQHQLH
jgi:hypothetical protein